MTQMALPYALTVGAGAPAAGQLGLSSVAAPAGVTELRPSSTDAAGLDAAAKWLTCPEGSTVLVAEGGSPRNETWVTTGPVSAVSAENYLSVPVAHQASGTQPLRNGSNVTATFDSTLDTPTLAEVRAWIQVPATVLTDPQLQQVIEAEGLNQRIACAPMPASYYPPDLAQALLRRVARHVAARGVPLGLIGLDAEYGASRLVRWDAEVDRLEAPWVSPVIA